MVAHARLRASVDRADAPGRTNAARARFITAGARVSGSLCALPGAMECRCKVGTVQKAVVWQDHQYAALSAATPTHEH